LKNLPNFSEKKSCLRKIVLGRRSGLEEKQRKIASSQAVVYFLESVDLEKTSIISLYWPIGDELDCYPLIEKLQQQGHKICLPSIVGAKQPLVFREFSAGDKLVSAAFGTSEPQSSAKILMPDMIVLPLAGFDKQGNRLGYGKGFYDRTIAAMAKKPELCGLAFAVQELDNIPASPHDVPLEKIITENGLIITQS